MKYSVCQWIYGDEPIEKTMGRLARIGYDGVEIMASQRKADVKQIRSLLGKHRLEATCITPPAEEDLSSPVGEVRKRAIAAYQESLDFAKKVGAHFMLVIPTAVPKIRPSQSFQQERKLAVESVKEVAEHAERTDVLLAIEAINRYETHMVNTAESALEFARDVDSDHVKIMLDAFHMNIEERDTVEAIWKAKDELIHFHVAGNNRQSIARGQINFIPIMRALKEVGYKGAIGAEPTAPLHDPFQAAKDEESRSLLDIYLDESIKMLRLYEATV